MKYLPIIGLEVHVELATKSKMFCGCPADHFGKEPNTNVCPVCLGLPGALPVPNKKAIEWTIMLGLALGSKINEDSYFERKNYFYPDLPKGYQISQNAMPFCVGGKLGNIRINNVHLEEDTGKLIHDGQDTLVDFNRSSVPLVEIVTEPDFRSIAEVDVYLKKLQRIIRYLGISQADMEKGSMRLEPSISLSIDGSLPNYRVELKNINSFRFVRKALEYEIERQQKENHVQETRGWDEKKGITVLQRTKEEAHDYRYFPEPDIPPFQISDIRIQIPELPEAKMNRFITQYGLTAYQANIIVEDKIVADYFEQCKTVDAANWIINKKVDITKISPKELLEQIAPSKKSIQIDSSKLEKVIAQVFLEHPQAVTDYQAGKTQIIGFLLGRVKSMYNNDSRLDMEKIRSLILKTLTE